MRKRITNCDSSRMKRGARGGALSAVESLAMPIKMRA